MKVIMRPSDMKRRGGMLVALLLAVGCGHASSAPESVRSRMLLGEASSYLDPALGSDRPGVSATAARKDARVPMQTQGHSTVRLARYTSTSEGPGYHDVLVWAFITTGFTAAGAGPVPLRSSNCSQVWLVDARSGADLGGVGWCPDPKAKSHSNSTSKAGS
jgi:hypothetical protein